MLAKLTKPPDVLYVDAAHDTDAVFADVLLAHILLPDTFVFGDDWEWDSVRAAVTRVAALLHREIETNGGNVWWFKQR